jgi:hypothetical protein
MSGRIKEHEGLRWFISVPLTIIFLAGIGWAIWWGMTNNGLPDYRANTVPVSTTDPFYEDPVTHMFNVPKDYWGTVNTEITLQQLQDNSELIREILVLPQEIQYYAKAFVTFYEASVVGVHGRTLDLARGDAKLSVYIGLDTRVTLILNGALMDGKFEDIRIGDSVSMPGVLQYGRGDPLFVRWLQIIRRTY